uniref:Uncharacterized protein n=1 Tax=Arundo donax TaxID=35708 RepID=A0A0A9GYT9_ARUDO
MLHKYYETASGFFFFMLCLPFQKTTESG